MRFNHPMRSGERTTTDTPVEARAARTVLSRHLALLSAFDAANPHLTLAELARRGGLPKTTAHRLAGELVTERLLERSAEGTYTLGIRLFEIGELVPRPRSLSAVALPVMEDLREVTRQRIHLAVLDGVDVLYVEILGSGGAPVTSRTGGRWPAHATGIGKVMLAYSSNAVVRDRIEAGLPRFTPRTIVTPGALTRSLQAIRSEGLAYDREESHAGISCVAAPVFGADRKIAAGLSITGRTSSIDPVRLGAAVRTAAQTLSRGLRGAGI